MHSSLLMFLEPLIISLHKQIGSNEVKFQLRFPELRMELLYLVSFRERYFVAFLFVSDGSFCYSCPGMLFYAKATHWTPRKEA